MIFQSINIQKNSYIFFKARYWFGLFCLVTFVAVSSLAISLLVVTGLLWGRRKGNWDSIRTKNIQNSAIKTSLKLLYFNDRYFTSHNELSVEENVLLELKNTSEIFVFNLNSIHRCCSPVKRPKWTDQSNQVTLKAVYPSRWQIRKIIKFPWICKLWDVLSEKHSSIEIDEGKRAFVVFGCDC